ncbi:MAG: thioredoxin [Rhizobiaceae bacterium]
MNNNDGNPQIKASFSQGFGAVPENEISFGSDVGNSRPRGPEPVLEVSTANFMHEVIEESANRPVLVDFWAPWCGPCKQLAPALEKVVGETRGAVRLVKMNIDDHPQIAGQMDIQSIPAVVAFSKGQPVDAFMGAKPEGEIRKFVEKLAGPIGPSPIDAMLEDAARHAASGATGEAAGLYAAILQEEPENVAALAGIGMLYMEQGELDRARAMLQAIPENKRSQPAAAGLASAIEIAEQASSVGELDELNLLIEANPKDWQARFDLALALNARGRREEAADSLLEIIRRDRKWKEDGAREQLLKFFEAWGPTDPDTLSARRRLSSALFS